METQEPISKKFGTVAYVWEANPYAKFRASPATGDFSANAWNTTEIFFINIYFFGNSPTGQTYQRIFTCDVSNDVVWCNSVPFGG